MSDLLDDTEAQAWQAFANCLGSDPELFFPDDHRASAIAAAKEVCAGCVVRRECLAYAINQREDHGVWGGLSGPERLRLRRRYARHLDERFGA